MLNTNTNFSNIKILLVGIYASILLRFPFSWMKKIVLSPSFYDKKNSVPAADLFLLSDRITSLESLFPWRYKCYEQAVTARILLNCRKQPNKLFIGFKVSSDKKEFHAWSECQNLVLTGYQNIHQYHILNQFD